MLTKEEESRLQELTRKKKKSKLDEKEFKEFKDLVKRSKDKGNKSFDPGNDPSWWMKYPDLVRDCASFKSNYIPGRVIYGSRIPYIVPGVMVVNLKTCYHPGFSAVDPINVWARDNYLKMFQKYRPASGYSASDQGIAILAGLEVVKLIAIYERIYGVINRYSVLNVNMPDVEARALGLTATQLAYLQSHLSDFRYDLNFLIKKAQRLCIPKDMSIISDIISLLGYEYIDHDNPRGQIIIFNLLEYGLYDEVSLSTGGEIEFGNILPTNLFDFNRDNMCSALDSALSALLGSDSIQRIYADLVVWFGEEAMLQFLPIPEDYLIVPVKSESILHKIHNLETAPAPRSPGDDSPNTRNLTSWAINGLSTSDESLILNGAYHVYQYMDSIVTVGVIKDNNTGTPTVFPFNGHSGKVLVGTANVVGMEDVHVADGYNVDVTPDFIIEATLLKCASNCKVSGSPVYAQAITSCVDWIVDSINLYNTSGTAAGTHTVNNGVQSTFIRQVAGRYSLIDWAPLAYVLGGTNGARTIDEIYGDLDVIVPMDEGNLEKIHRTCILSALKFDNPVKG